MGICEVRIYYDLREWVLPKQLGSNLLRPDSTFGQPAAKIGDQADLDFSRIPGVALAAHLGLVGIEVRNQGTVLFTKL